MYIGVQASVETILGAIFQTYIRWVVDNSNNLYSPGTAIAGMDTLMVRTRRQILETFLMTASLPEFWTTMGR